MYEAFRSRLVNTAVIGWFTTVIDAVINSIKWEWEWEWELESCAEGSP